VLFAALPGNIIQSNENTTTLKAGLSAALTPSIADASKNKAIMKQLWNPIVDPIKSGIQTSLTAAVASAEKGKPAAADPLILTAIAKGAHATVVGNTVEVDWSNAAQRNFYVDKSVSTIVTKLKDGSTAKSSSSSVSDTSFLNGASPALTKAFKVGFNTSVVSIYWIGLGVILLAFIITLFFRVPPLRGKSALQQRADEAGTTETGRIRTQVEV
jgi:hypothetical protein